MDKHKAKIKLARKLMSPKELKERTPLFDSKEWIKRKEAISTRLQAKRLTK